jgi:hypothetical protein
VKSYNLLTVHPPGRATRWYVDGKRVTCEAFERIWDRAWFNCALDSSVTRVGRDETIRHYVCARV